MKTPKKAPTANASAKPLHVQGAALAKIREAVQAHAQALSALGATELQLASLRELKAKQVKAAAAADEARAQLVRDAVRMVGVDPERGTQVDLATGAITLTVAKA